MIKFDSNNKNFTLIYGIKIIEINIRNVISFRLSRFFLPKMNCEYVLNIKLNQYNEFFHR